MRSRRVVLIALCGLMAATAAIAGSQPVAVSPGDASKLALIGDTCPTFSWGEVEGASSYELVVYRLGVESAETQPILRQTFAGSASSWTPSLDRCLDRGGRYAWSVRAMRGRVASVWSQPSLFQVASEPSEEELAAALTVVQRYLEVRGGSSGSGLIAPEIVTGESSSGELAAEAPEPHASAATQLNVDGGVLAASFTGDGTGITNVVATGLNCTDCVTESEIAPGAVALAEMASGTAGNLIAYDTSGDPAYVATGSPGLVLTSNGAGAAPTFQGAGDVTNVGDSSGPTAFTGNNDGNTLIFEGTTNNAFDVVLSAVDPTASRTLLLPDASGTLATTTALIPVGAIVAFGGTVAPAGWALCDGSVVPRAGFADLYAVIGNAWGEGDGATTFHLPDLHGRFQRVVDGGVGRVNYIIKYRAHIGGMLDNRGGQ